MQQRQDDARDAATGPRNILADSNEPTWDGATPRVQVGTDTIHAIPRETGLSRGRFVGTIVTSEDGTDIVRINGVHRAGVENWSGNLSGSQITPELQARYDSITEDSIVSRQELQSFMRLAYSTASHGENQDPSPTPSDSSNQRERS